MTDIMHDNLIVPSENAQLDMDTIKKVGEDLHKFIDGVGHGRESYRLGGSS